MLTVDFIKDNKAKVIEGLKKRNFKNITLIESALKLDSIRKSTQFELDTQLAEANKISKEIGVFLKEKKNEQAQILKEKTQYLKEHSKLLQEKLLKIQEELVQLLYQIPNIPYEKVKAGNSSDENEEVYRNGIACRNPNRLLPHWELAKKYQLIDFELGVKITGSGFPIYLGKGARLQRALIQYFLDVNIEAGYKEVIPPFLVNEASAYGTGQLPDKEGQMYHDKQDNLYLIPTSEVPLTNIYRDVLLQPLDLPIKMTAYSPCFRREAGSYGKEVRGLNRLHQFEKVEIVRIEKPENSYAALEEMVEHIKNLMEDLELPFRILRLCGGDTSFASAMTYDFEVWSAAQERWLEVSSVSNFETFQANRLKLRYKEEGKPQLCHTLNGSALALPRILAGLLENHQMDKGIIIPKKLRKYTGFDSIE